MNLSTSIRLTPDDPIDAEHGPYSTFVFVVIGEFHDASIHARSADDYERLAAACIEAANILREREQPTLTLADVSPEDAADQEQADRDYEAAEL